MDILQPFKTMTATLKKRLNVQAFLTLHFHFFFWQFSITKCPKNILLHTLQYCFHVNQIMSIK